MRKYEGSREDNRRDAAGARKAGMTAKQWERSPQDRKMDREGQKAMAAKGMKRK